MSRARASCWTPSNRAPTPLRRCTTALSPSFPLFLLLWLSHFFFLSLSCSLCCPSRPTGHQRHCYGASCLHPKTKIRLFLHENYYTNAFEPDLCLVGATSIVLHVIKSGINATAKVHCAAGVRQGFPDEIARKGSFAVSESPGLSLTATRVRQGWVAYSDPGKARLGCSGAESILVLKNSRLTSVN